MKRAGHKENKAHPARSAGCSDLLGELLTVDESGNVRKMYRDLLTASSGQA
jgi:hypothetical protein